MLMPPLPAHDYLWRTLRAATQRALRFTALLMRYDDDDASTLPTHAVRDEMAAYQRTIALCSWCAICYAD